MTRPSRGPGRKVIVTRAAPAEARDAETRRPGAPASGEEQRRGAFEAPPRRNPLVAAVMQRKAGTHRKPHKALRRALRSRGEEPGQD
ncbi:hypothetical protein [Derxia lacustris]|uniref:hypothetical protein n=1 Tax=Derxia lacustris TaxID=764842 RepID=UPI000A171812|nr:hypothetical protein [Derxia lacustris]